MPTVCARFNCQEVGAASLQFDTEGSRVLLVDLTETFAGIPICAHHATTRTAPMGWRIVDERTLSKQLELVDDVEESVAEAPTARPAMRRSEEASPFTWDRRARQEAHNIDVDEKPETPLLSRAFRLA